MICKKKPRCAKHIRTPRRGTTRIILPKREYLSKKITVFFRCMLRAVGPFRTHRSRATFGLTSRGLAPSAHSLCERLDLLLSVTAFKALTKGLCKVQQTLGAGNQNRTDDLVITNDVLYRLSHTSIAADTSTTRILYQTKKVLSRPFFIFLSLFDKVF